MPSSHVLRKLPGCVLTAVFLLLAAHSASAQQDYKGFTAFVDARGSTSDQGQFTIIDSSVGYQFNRHFSVDAGVPIYFLRVTPPNQQHSWNEDTGDPYLDVALTFENHI